MTVVMKATLRLVCSIAALCLSMALPASAQDWQAKEVVKTYAISGSSGIALYQSIGEKGPATSVGTRAIAHTTWDLRWSRKYEPQADKSCRLVSARPIVTIIYTLPKPSAKLSGPVAGHWQTFLQGIEAHEKVHGRMIREMVDEIIATTVGLTVADDPKCRKIRKDIELPLIAARDAYRAKSREFDRVEMSDGGNVHRLVLALVNGG